MPVHLAPPRIRVSSVDPLTHRVDTLDSEGVATAHLPAGVTVVEIWAAFIPSGADVGRVYLNFLWMKPATRLPVNVSLSSVTGRDAVSSAHYTLMYRARWIKDGAPVSGWSNTAVADPGGRLLTPPGAVTPRP